MRLRTGIASHAPIETTEAEWQMAIDDSPSVTPTGGASTSAILGFEKELTKLARWQLRGDASLVADVVQETLMAAIQDAARFRGDSSLKTWLVGILKFKVIDALRARARQPLPLTTLAPELSTEDLDALFDETGVWQTKPRDWTDPAFAAQQGDFLRILEFCLTELPTHSARAFMLREMFELDTDEICRTLAITPNHLGVLLYRARMTLRRCLEDEWLDREEDTP
jgi:RNA polymerase sigma-70 factor (ECF subfamily)